MQEGFTMGRSLASKTHYLFQHMKDTFSKQFHYDFGMRAYKSSVTHAGNYLRAQTDINPDNEHMALMTSINDHMRPKLATQDELAFRSILDQVFFGHKVEVSANRAEQEAMVSEALTGSGRKDSKMQVGKALDLD